MKTNIKISVYTIAEESKLYENGLRANVSITINDEFAVRNIKIINGKHGDFVAFPNVKSKKDDEYLDIFFPITAKARKEIVDLILEAYNKKK